MSPLKNKEQFGKLNIHTLEFKIDRRNPQDIFVLWKSLDK